MDQELQDILDQAKSDSFKEEAESVFDKAAKRQKLDPETKNIFDQASKNPSTIDIFATDAKKNVNARDVFSGPDALFELIENTTGTTAGSAVDKTKSHVKKKAGQFISSSNIIILLNIVVITAILAFLILKSKYEPKANTTEETIAIVQALTSAPEIVADDLSISEAKANALENASSWQLGEKLFNAQQYNEAYLVFQKLKNDLNSGLTSDEYLKDFLSLKMALCLEYTNYPEDISKLFTVALQSRSPVVRALANYHMMFIGMNKKQYLKVRTRAYRTLSLIASLEETLYPNIEADCYFIASEAMTRYILNLNNEDEELPGKLWSDSLSTFPLPDMDQSQLRSFLQSGIYHLNEGAITPKIEIHDHLKIGSRWSALAVDAPLEEVLNRYGSTAKIDIHWTTLQEGLKNRPTTLFLPTTTEFFIPEAAAGSTGLLARMEAGSIDIYNPDTYTNFEEHKQLLTAETISMWRRYLIRFRGDHRCPNAHYALGVMEEFHNEDHVALGEYRLIASQFPNNPIAPFALLNSSKIKTNIKDFTGASHDLQEILVQYPDCRLVDQASLYLAESTMKSGLYDDAIKMFRKAYNIDLNPESQRTSAYGLAYCHYQLKNWEDAKKWAIDAIKQTTNPSDHRLRPTYFMLGKINIELGEYQQASIALKNSIDSAAPREEYINTIVNLVDAEILQEHFINALNILQSIPTIHLSQELSAKILIKKSQILQEIDLIDTAMTLLRQKIEYIADSEIRAELSYELAKCYVYKEDFKPAFKELMDNLGYLPPGIKSQRAKLLLAEVLLKQKDYRNAIKYALQLEQDITDTDIKKAASQIRGKAHDNLGEFDKAALAYAGIIPNMGGNK